MKAIEFRLRGNDPSAQRLRAMLDGLKNHAGDTTMQISETMVVTVTTDRDDVAAALAKLGQTEKPKKQYTKRKGLTEAAE